MVDINVQNDLDAVNNQIETMTEELRKVEAARENIITQITNLQGVSMYLRGKLATDDTEVEVVEDEDLETEVETPEE